MSNKHSPNICNDLYEKFSEKPDTLLNEDIIQDSKNRVINILESPQLLSYKVNNSSQDFINETIKQLCNLYIEEEKKGNYDTSILSSIEQYLISKQQNPANVIECLGPRQIVNHLVWINTKLKTPKYKQ
ncbi:16249_t:CDS:2 [Cetraspora pellucida]|uniref:16249_t:CDS:1 n=1 Tax=Cetraspora pellucida TaxID=1433469 RepID=A0A9N9AKU6_9GLOM|nr:16249_t:CDS:2 [Cetraspora pellucida]